MDGLVKKWIFPCFVYGVIALGVLIFGLSVWYLDVSQVSLPLFVTFLLITFISEIMPIHLPYGTAISVSFAVVYAAILLVSPLFAALVAFGGMTLGTITGGLKKALFNGSQFALSAFASGLVFQYLRGYQFHWDTFVFYGAVFSSIIIFFLCNVLLIIAVVSMSSGTAVRTLWRQNINGIIIQYFAMFPFSLLLALIYTNIGYWGVVLFFIPLMVARYSFKLYADTKKSQLALLRALTAAIDAKDPYTRGHSARVAELSLAIAEKIRLSNRGREMLEYASLLHDVGKIGINDSILSKSSGLDDEEYLVVKEHPVIGEEIISEVDFLREAARFVRAHHERCDGSGYPDRKRGSEIPLEARILAVTDVFDALTSDRPYRKAYPVEEALRIMNNDERSFYDAEVLEALYVVLEDVRNHQ
ncbi:MAG TPA: HD-GYP domain-containing protein [Atribacteraceae bacterium]|nr:HD-GYP domain-containing protein [Atribacteraceae bacterium]